jgi:putative ABC transport system ATP-binding protein
MELFKEIAVREGRVLVIVTHDQRIYPFADRIAKLDDGMVQKVSSGREFEVGK